MDFYQVVNTRRSIRRYRDRTVPPPVLLRLCEAFRAAPSWANTQPWELILVRDASVKKKLQGTLSAGNPATKAIVQAPVLFCIIGIPHRSGWYGGEPVTRRGDWMMFDLGIATEHLVLAAAAEGLGTVHVAYFDFEKAGQILNLPPERTVVEMVPLGFPDHPPRPVSRKPLEEFVFDNHHGARPDFLTP